MNSSCTRDRTYEFRAKIAATTTMDTTDPLLTAKCVITRRPVSPPPTALVYGFNLALIIAPRVLPRTLLLYRDYAYATFSYVRSKLRKKSDIESIEPPDNEAPRAIVRSCNNGFSGEAQFVSCH